MTKEKMKRPVMSALVLAVLTVACGATEPPPIMIETAEVTRIVEVEKEVTRIVEKPITVVVTNTPIQAQVSAVPTLPPLPGDTPISEPQQCVKGSVIPSPGAEEHFQHGVMVWVEAMDRIYVLYDDSFHPKWQIFTDEFEEGMPQSDPNIEVPSSLYQPVRGFGLAWRTKPWVRDRLGWAVDEERSFQTTVQTLRCPGYEVIHIDALDGSMWELWPSASGWSRRGEG